jgi:hypothetical protein
MAESGRRSLSTFDPKDSIMTIGHDIAPRPAVPADQTCDACGLRLNRRLSSEDMFLIFVVVFSLAAAVALALPFKAPPAVIALLAAIAVSTLVYRFLGGIPAETKLVLKTIQLGGTLAALVALYLLLNGSLVKQQHVDGAFRPEELEGTWEQSYPEGGWRGSYRLQRDPTLAVGQFRVSGVLRKVDGGRSVDLLQVLDNSIAQATKDGLALKLRLRVKDGMGSWNNKVITWETLAPMRRTPATSGVLQVRLENAKEQEADPWGLALMKVN